MNLRQKIALGLLLSITLCSAAFAQIVEMPDPNLKHAVIEALNLPAGAPITQDDMRQLKRLDTLRAGITSLQGLEFATELERLVIPRSPVTDLTPISQLVKLRYLDASGCKIVDITPLANLKELVSLNLERNRIRDVSPLAELVNLRTLYIQNNPVLDFSSLDNLRLTTFEYDEVCEMDPLPLEPRLANRSYPNIMAAEYLVGADSRVDLMFGGGYMHMELRADGILVGELEKAVRQRDNLIAANPNLVFLIVIPMRTAGIGYFPDDSPYWVRDSAGKIVPAVEDGIPRGRFIDFTHPHVQDLIVEQAIAVSKCGLFDGIVFDWWRDKGYDVFPGDLVSPDKQFQARINILYRIRAQVRPNFLIQVNSNWRKLPYTGQYINGLSMELGLPYWGRTEEEREVILNRAEDTLAWAEEHLREPRINGVVGEAFRPPEPTDSPINLRWMRVLATLSLTFADGYSVTQVAQYEAFDERHWYDFWKADLGQPVGAKRQLYDNREGLYIREFTNGWAVYNHSGEAQVITFPKKVQGVASGLVNTEHALPNLDGEMYLKETTEVHGNDIYIAEPINAVSGAALLLDASNNPGTTAHWVNHWVNLGTVGESLQASRAPRIEEGEIEIPSIGFSGRRRFYTATASGQTFGGPVDANPKLYLGDWTLEFLCKRNGSRFALEHQFAGFQNSPRGKLQGIRLWLPKDGQELSMSIHADGFRQPERALNVFLEENVWTWVTIISINGESIVAYQDGVKVSRHPGVYFDANLPLDDISIGSFSYDERDRNFNGSFSIVRVYDRALSPDEVLQNIGATVIPTANPADVNDDGEVNILDLVAVASNLSQTGENDADVNGDGVVNILDLVQVAGAIGGGGAAPSASSLDLSMISAADVERWLALAQGLGVGDVNYQQGIRFLQQLLALLTPKNTMLLPNFPNPFNPETWIAYRLAREAEVTITIYDTKGTLVRQLALGNQAAGYYAARGKAAYWDGRNARGEAVASGIYFYQLRAGDYVASRRMVIVK